MEERFLTTLVLLQPSFCLSVRVMVCLYISRTHCHNGLTCMPIIGNKLKSLYPKLGVCRRLKDKERIARIIQRVQARYEKRTKPPALYTQPVPPPTSKSYLHTLLPVP